MRKVEEEKIKKVKDEYVIIRMLDEYESCSDEAVECEDECKYECECEEESCLKECDKCITECTDDVHEACKEKIAKEYNVPLEWLIKVLNGYEACVKSCVKEEEKKWTLADHMELPSSPHEVCGYVCAPLIAKQFAS